MDEALAVLREEFEGAEDSFLIRIYGSLEWDRAAFSRLERAMREVCAAYQGRDHLERWIAEGFHDIPRYVRDVTSHPNFRRPEPQEYYEDCLERLDDLADWFFRGFHAYQEPYVWPDL